MIRLSSMRNDDGWTLSELLIVVAIFAILSIIFLLVNWRKNVFRAQDARRKTDISNIRRAFEEYYNDNECYPELTILNNCDGTNLNPYLRTIPCDPATREPYKYQPDEDTNVCLGNRICTKLLDTHDPDITALGCDGVNGCGWGQYWNYCLAAGTTVTAPGFDPSEGYVPTATPVITPYYQGGYACGNDGTCQNVGDPIGAGCLRSWSESNCQGMCPGNPQLWCP